MLARLAFEIRAAFDRVEDVRSPPLNTRLPYLNAVLEEAMRLAPTVTSAFPREVLAGGINVGGGVYVPAGMTVGVSAYAIHHNKAYYPDSFAFVPKRWMGDKESVKFARSAFFTFGAGPYNCIGRGWAVLARKLALAKMLYAYDVRAPANSKVTGDGGLGLGRGRKRDDEYQLEDCMVSYRNGPLVQLRAGDM
jgi:cytochrome P450